MDNIWFPVFVYEQLYERGVWITVASLVWYRDMFQPLFLTIRAVNCVERLMYSPLCLCTDARKWGILKVSSRRTKFQAPLE